MSLKFSKNVDFSSKLSYWSLVRDFMGNILAPNKIRKVIDNIFIIISYKF